MLNDTEFVLAMYDVRGKQNFIFRTNKLKEIVGGSCIIRDVFDDYLYPAAIQYRNKYYGLDMSCQEPAIYKYDKKSPASFCTKDFQERMQGQQYIGEVVYDGGGNFLVLYKDEMTFVEINKRFTKSILENIGTLNVLCTCVTVSDTNLTNYKLDNEKLYKKHERLEASETVVRPVSGIPFVQIDAETSMPLTNLCVTEGTEANPIMQEKLSTESAAKHRKYLEVSRKDEDTYGQVVLDKLVGKKGEDSLLAVIFIDGNSMGAQVQNVFKKNANEEIDTSYDERVTKLRLFSAGIQKEYVDDRVDAIQKRLAMKRGSQSDKTRRMIVFAGDEMSFVTRASDALDAVKAYFEELGKSEEHTGASSCAGISIFHSHAPYAEAYKIAEACCETGKRHMKGQNPPELKTCYVDFQFCHSGLGRSLEDLRESEIGELISKPWLVKNNGTECSNAVTLEEVNKVVDGLRAIGSRTNVKALIQPAEKSLTDFNLEMDRIYAHQSKSIQNIPEVKYVFAKDDERKCMKKDEYRRRLIYDIATVYDLWFREEV